MPTREKTEVTLVLGYMKTPAKIDTYLFRLIVHTITQWKHYTITPITPWFPIHHLRTLPINLCTSR